MKAHLENLLEHVRCLNGDLKRNDYNRLKQKQTDYYISVIDDNVLNIIYWANELKKEMSKLPEPPIPSKVIVTRRILNDLMKPIEVQRNREIPKQDAWHRNRGL